MRPDLTIAPAAYPFGEAADTDPAAPDAYFPECLSAARSFCLRVSGAVVPSAAAISAGLSRAGPGRFLRRADPVKAECAFSIIRDFCSPALDAMPIGPMST